MVFAITVFPLLNAKIVQIGGFELPPRQAEAEQHVLWVIGFFSGFSERFAPKILEKIFEQVGS